jgi:hypothetical protein
VIAVSSIGIHSRLEAAKALAKISEFAKQLQVRIDRTLHGPITPNAETTFKLRKVNDNVSILALALLSWYLEDSGRCLLQLELSNLKLQPLQAQESLWIILNSRSDALDYISTFSEREIYGTWIPRCQQVARLAEIYNVSPSKARRLVRRRGYRDHGSIRRSDKWLPDSDFELDELQRKIETEEDFRKLVLSSISKFGLTGLRARKISS